MGRDIQVEEYIPKRRSVKLRLFFFGLKVTAVIGVCLGITHVTTKALEVATARAMEAKEAVLEKVTVVRTVTEYREIDNATLGEIIVKTAKEYNVDPLILTVLAEKESSGGEKLYRFEPGKFDELRSSAKYKGLSTDELRMIASSHGIFHVMGYSAQQYCSLPWHRLYDPWSSAKCAATIVSKLYKDTETIRAPSARVREVFRRYNGAGELAERYADDAMNRLAGILYDRVAKPS